MVSPDCFFINLAVLKDIIEFLLSLIGAEGTKTPAGVPGTGDPAGALAPREAPPLPPANRSYLERKSTD